MITGSTLEYSQISQGSKICRIVCSYSLDTVVKENISTFSREEKCTEQNLYGSLSLGKVTLYFKNI